MGTGILKTALAIILVTCVVVIVVSPFVDLPLTVENTKAHVPFHVAHISVLLDSQVLAEAPPISFEPARLAPELSKLDILVTYRC